MESNYRYLSYLSLISILVISTLAIYWPGLDGVYLFDDYETLQTLNSFGGVTNLETLKYFIYNNSTGPTGRPISMLSFLINDQYWPGSPWFYKYTNLLIHILCGLMIVLIIFKLCLALNINEKESGIMAIACAAIWLLHPLNVSTTLYIIQRMTQLAVLFTLSGLYLYLIGREVIDHKQWKGLVLICLSLIPFGLFATLSKENGILILVYILVIEITIFHNKPRNKITNIWLLILVILPLFAALVYVVFNWGNFVSSFQARDFTIYERLLSESRVLITYISLIFLPRLSGLGLFHDDIEISTSIIEPITTLLCIIVIAGLLFAGFNYRKKTPVLSFAIFWFFGGHLLESTFYNLELYFEHRNYLPMLGPIFGIVYSYRAISNRFLVNKNKWISNSIPFIYIGFLGLLTYQTSLMWSHPSRMFPVWAAEHPNSNRAQTVYAQFLEVANKPKLALDVMIENYKNHPSDISIPIAMLNLSCKFYLTAPYSAIEIIEFAKNSKYENAFKHELKKLVVNASEKKCSNISANELHKLLYTIETIPAVKRRSRKMANLSFQHAELYVSEGNLPDAMKMFDQARYYQGNVAIALRQVTLLISAGLYNEALEYIDKARVINNKRKFPKPSRENEISMLEKHILKQLDELQS